MKERSIVAAIVLVATALLVLGLLMRGNLEIAPAQRHVFAALILAGAALSGIVLRVLRGASVRPHYTAGTGWVTGIGWVAAVGILAMALFVIWGNGFKLTPSGTVAAVAPSPAAAGPPNVARGGALFRKNCASCHGVEGGGGDSPAIMDERARKSLAQLEQWIENPAAPMPKLYPKPLSLQDVADIAGYIDNPAMSAMLKKKPR
jgi:mono/diheme cytochrome c family protein